MKKILFYVITILVYSNMFSQVGIGTTNPQSALDIRSSNQVTPVNTDGLLIPKVDQFSATNPTATQHGMLVQLTITDGTDTPGFYYWNNPTTTWLPLAAGGNSFWDRNSASGYLFPQTTSDRVEIFTDTDANGIAGTGSFEIANSLRIDGNEVITNTETELFLQYGNAGDLSIDNTTLFVDSSVNNVGIGTMTPDARLEIYNTTAAEQSLLVSKTSGATEAVRVENTGTGVGLYNYNNTNSNGTALYNYGTGRSLYVYKDATTGEAARIQNYGSGTGLYVYNNSTANGTSLYNYGSGRGLYVYKANGTGEGVYINNYASGSGLNVRSNNIAANGISASSGNFYCDLGWATHTGPTWGITTGVKGLNAASDIIGVEGRANWSNTNTTDKMGGLFYVSGTNGGTTSWYSPAVAAVGSIVDNTVYKIVGFGIVSTLVKDTEEKDRVMIAPEAPEALFQDYGIGQLTNGRAHITLDPILTKNIAVDKNHPLKVFVQLEGDCKGVYVTNKSETGFDVIELNNGQSNTQFSYQLIANRTNENRGGQISNYADMRFKPFSKKFMEKKTEEMSVDEELETKKEIEPKPRIKEERKEKRKEE